MTRQSLSPLLLALRACAPLTRLLGRLERALGLRVDVDDLAHNLALGLVVGLAAVRLLVEHGQDVANRLLLGDGR